MPAYPHSSMSTKSWVVPIGSPFASQRPKMFYLWIWDVVEILASDNLAVGEMLKSRISSINQICIFELKIFCVLRVIHSHFWKLENSGKQRSTRKQHIISCTQKLLWIVLAYFLPRFFFFFFSPSSRSWEHVVSPCPPIVSYLSLKALFHGPDLVQWHGPPCCSSGTSKTLLS